MINSCKEFELLPMSHGLWDRFATVCGIAPSQTVADFFMYNFTIKNYESRKKNDTVIHLNSCKISNPTNCGENVSLPYDHKVCYTSLMAWHKYQVSSKFLMDWEMDDQWTMK